MQNTQIYNRIALVLTVAAVAACLLAPRIPVGETHPVAVATFPRVVDDWKDVEDRPQDPGLKADLPTATIVERMYRRPGGHDIDLLLLTASSEADFHDPTVCLPSQGWATVSNSSTVRYNDVMHDLEAKLDRHAVNIVYWTTGDYASKRAKTLWMKNLYRVRSHFVSNEEGACLMVRVITDDSQAARQEGLRFIDAIQPALAQLKSSGTKVSSLAATKTVAPDRPV